MLGYINKTPSDTDHFNDSVRAFIAALNFLSCPTAIIWIVAQTIVFSLQSQIAFWRITHVGVKVLEVEPAFTDVYSSATIGIPPGLIRISATLNHAHPNRVDFGIVLPMLNSRTATRFCAAANQIDDTDNFLFSAFTAAENCVTVSVFTNNRWAIGYNFPPSKGTPDERLFRRFAHNVHSVMIRFSGGRPALTGAHCDYAETLN